MLQAGDMAPDFDVPVLIGGVRKQFRLSEHRGTDNLVLAFYPTNWEPISAQQMVAFQVQREKFLEREAEVLTMSVDCIMNTTAWEREIGPFDFFMGSDFWPHGEVSRRYGGLREQEPAKGASERAIFIVDKAGIVRFAQIYPMDRLPDLEETLDVLRQVART